MISDNDVFMSPEEKKATAADLKMAFDDKATVYVILILFSNNIFHCHLFPTFPTWKTCLPEIVYREINSFILQQFQIRR